MNYAQRKRFFLENISRDIEAHESGRFDEIGAWEKTRPRWEECDDGEEKSRHLTAYEFCCSWQDSRNHDWNYYPSVAEKD